MNKKIIISVVGGGSTGVAFLAQFARKITAHVYKDKFEINIFESTNPLGTGLAYNVKSHSLLLNSSTVAFSVYSEDSKDFLKWLLQFPEKWRPDFPEIGEVNEHSFLPRKLAGVYLKDCFEQAKKFCEAHRIKVRLLKEEVIDIIEHNFSTQILTHKGNQYKSDYIILCTGNIPSEKFKELKRYLTYIHSPYHEGEERLKRVIPLNASVLVLGTRLSAIDVIMLLRENGHRGKITMASREGIFPAVKDELSYYPLKYLTIDNIALQLMKNNSILKIENLLELIQKEVSYIYQKFISRKKILSYSGDPRRILKIDLYKAKQKRVSWGKIQMEFFNLIDEYWKAFPIEEKKKYLKDYLGIMQRYTSSFPIINAEKMLDLMERGQLMLQSGLENLYYNKKSNSFIGVFNEKKKGKHSQEFNYAINATGCGKDLHNSPSQLYTNLIRSNKLELNAFGGLDVSPEDFSIRTKGKFTAKLYAAGPPTFGSVFFTNFVLMSAKQTEVILVDILRNYRVKKLY